MAYEPKTWVCGETITADGLNNIEEGIQDALECCESGPGYSCSFTYDTIDEESVTTTDDYGSGYGYGELQNPFTQYDVIRVTFDGEEYVVSPNPNDQSYGAPYDASWNLDWSTYPFRIDMTTPGNTYYPLYTETAATHSIKIEAQVDAFELSECFEKVLKIYSLKNIRDASDGGIIEGNINGQYCKNEASGLNAHAEGGYYTEAEGGVCQKTIASGDCSHAEGLDTEASGNNSHAEGYNTTASGSDSHAEGSSATASGSDSHAEGYNTTASGSDSHAEGYKTTASGNNSHAEGSNTTASGNNSHAEGWQTRANHKSQHVFGEANIEDPSSAAATAKGTYIEIVGNGTSNSNRSNARTLDWNGNEVLKGSLTLGQGTADETTITATQLKALLALL